MNTSGLFCQWCGELNEADARVCKKCGAVQPQTGGAPAQAGGSVGPTGAASAPGQYQAPLGAVGMGQVPPGTAYPPTVFGPPAPPYAVGFRGYGGFWIRFLAILIDGIVLSVVIVPLMFIIMGPAIAAAMASARGMRPGQPPDPAMMMAFMSIAPLAALAAIGVTWIYEAALTSSPKQATLGKMALGLKVVDKEGRRLSFLHATGRYFAKLLNRFTLMIGYIIAGFTERKQALHDFIAGTYVIKT